MKRFKKHVLLVIALTLLAAFAPGFETSAEAIVIKFATLLPRGAPGDKESREIFTKLAKDSDNEIVIKIYEGGVAGDEGDVIRKMRAGRIHMSAFTGNGLGTILPEIRALELPALYKNYGEEDFVKARLFDRFAKGFAEKGYVMLGLGGGGFVYMFTAQKITGIEDAGKVKMWTWKGDHLTEIGFKALGINAIPLHIADVNVALETGMIDSFYITPMGSTALQWYHKARFILDHPVGIVTGAMIVNKNIFDSLSPKGQATLKAAIQDNVTTGLAMIRELDANALKVLKASGIEFVKPSAEQIDFYEVKSREVAELCIQEGMFPRELYDEIHKLLKEYRATHP